MTLSELQPNLRVLSKNWGVMGAVETASGALVETAIKIQEFLNGACPPVGPQL